MAALPPLCVPPWCRLGQEDAAKQASLAALTTALAERQGALQAVEQRLREAGTRLEGAEAEVGLGFGLRAGA